MMFLPRTLTAVLLTLVISGCCGVSGLYVCHPFDRVGPPALDADKLSQLRLGQTVTRVQTLLGSSQAGATYCGFSRMPAFRELTYALGSERFAHVVFSAHDDTLVAASTVMAQRTPRPEDYFLGADVCAVAP